MHDRDPGDREISPGCKSWLCRSQSQLCFALLCFFWLPEKYLSCRLTVSALFGFKILVELAFALHQEMKCKNTNIVSLSGVDTGF